MVIAHDDSWLRITKKVFEFAGLVSRIEGVEHQASSQAAQVEPQSVDGLFYLNGNPVPRNSAQGGQRARHAGGLFREIAVSGDNAVVVDQDWTVQIAGKVTGKTLIKIMTHLRVTRLERQGVGRHNGWRPQKPWPSGGPQGRLPADQRSAGPPVDPRLKTHRAWICLVGRSV